MATKVGTYRGYDIYRYEAKEGHGNNFPIYRSEGIGGFLKSNGSCEKAIDRKLAVDD